MSTQPAINDSTELKQLATTHTRQTTGSLTGDQKYLVDWFFMRLANIYGTEYKRTFNSAKELQFAKREWARNIIEYDQQELDIKLQRCKVFIAEDPRGWSRIKMSAILGIPTKGHVPKGGNPAAYLEFDSSDNARHAAAVERARNNPEVRQLIDSMKAEMEEACETDKLKRSGARGDSPADGGVSGPGREDTDDPLRGVDGAAADRREECEGERASVQGA